MFLWLAAQAAAFDLTELATPKTNVTCDGRATGDVVVCGVRPDRHRLPLPRETEAVAAAAPVGGMAAITPAGRCGIFAGERRCSKREALSYGYGGGRDPVSLVGGIVGAIVDPDR